MSDISRKALIEWAEDQPTTNAPYYHGMKACKEELLDDLSEGCFNGTESEGEATRLRTVINKAVEDLEDIIDLEPLKDFVREELKEIVQTLSSHREDAEES